MHRNASLNCRFFKLGSISDTATTVNQEEAPFSEASSIIRSIFGGAKSMIDLAIIHLKYRSSLFVPFSSAHVPVLLNHQEVRVFALEFVLPIVLLPFLIPNIPMLLHFMYL